MSEQRKLYCIHGTFPDHCGACQGQLLASLKQRIAELETENDRLEKAWLVKHARMIKMETASLEADKIISDGVNQLHTRIAELEKWKADIIESAQLSSMDADDQVCFVPKWLLQEKGDE